MKNNVNYVIQGILAIAVIILFVMYFSGKKSGTPALSTTTESGEQIAGFPVAYINVDSLLLKYNFSIDLNEQILKKQENARANYTQKARSLQSEAEEFQYKLQNGAFATRERAEQEQQRLMKKQQELQELDSRLTQELMEQTQAMNEQLRDTVVHYLKQYNQDKGYQIIFSNTAGSPIFLADDAYNITNEIVEYLNKRYSGAK
ncbi:OmpH family outer membrane protein [Tannerella forsythia]|uniref:OmpH family outer membrane protein n=1 Tax=Tannerella forsythia TaxID=28112 RepID=A0A3P1XNE4_TANFO|nr:OmpH family outer membrane protein [Tannerella forsythia]RRD60005.1 OmpH family outer membrane protein [Tannerella forsythia]RRD77765.1 OmpH family outer membrane protein [Tannerella forsythia]